MNQRYDIDHEWVRKQQEQGDGSMVTVRLTVTGTMAREGVLEWFRDLPADALGARGRGDWLVKEVISDQKHSVVDITAGGEDAAKNLEEGTDEAFDILDALGCDLEWEPLDQDAVKP